VVSGNLHENTPVILMCNVYSLQFGGISYHSVPAIW
jgi:hypothetical protein